VPGYCRVALDSPVLALDRPFDYAIPERLGGRLTVGSVVRVVLHGRSMRAFVTDLRDEPAVPDPRPVRSVVAVEPVFGSSELDLARWAGHRYIAALGHVLHDAVPGRFSAPRTDRPAAPFPGGVRSQGRMGAGITKVVEQRGNACVFPTSVRDEPEIAALVAGEAAARGGRTLVVCPRVEQAEAVAARVAGAAVLHGAERPRERAAVWAAARDGKIHVLVGVRSALLAPLPDLGAVCVLSSHDRSLKADRSPRLHALVVATQRAQANGAAFIASSPAPPVEVAAAAGIEWITGDPSGIRTEIARPRSGPVTPRLVDVVRSAIDAGLDALVFVGRLGTTLRLSCRDCGWRPTCVRCGAGLAQGEQSGRLACRVCGEQAWAPATCPSCGGDVAARGWGHERVAREVERVGVKAPVIRVVRGQVPTQRPRPSVLVGTLAAAHAAGEVGSVCVADLDQLLARPDFRAAERALQTLHDLAGVLRPGGRFLVQTREPEHHAVQAFTRRSYRYFFEREMAFRRETGYPPFGVIVRVQTPASSLDELRRTLSAVKAHVVGAVERRGIASALVRAAELEPMLEPLRSFAGAHARTRIDVDPIDVI
jgi:primosomal protein N' (replication factor Y)